jgi:hypothetical protein
MYMTTLMTASLLEASFACVGAECSSDLVRLGAGMQRGDALILPLRLSVEGVLHPLDHRFEPLHPVAKFLVPATVCRRAGRELSPHPDTQQVQALT